MVMLDLLAVSTALTSIREGLHATLPELEWTVNAYTLAIAVCLMSATALGDRFGRRRVFRAGVTVFVLASGACGLAPSVGWLIAARAVQGAGAAAVLPLSLTLVSTAFPAEKRGSALGIFNGLTGLAVLAGPVIGGAVTQGLAWRWIFWLNVPIGVLIIAFASTWIAESRGPNVRVDLVGLALISAAATAIVWGLVRANSAGWGSFVTVASLVGGMLVVLGFVYWEQGSPAPMLPLGLFKSRRFLLGNSAILLLNAALLAAVFFMAQYQQDGLGQRPLDAGLRLLPWTAMLFVVAPLAGASIERAGERTLMVAGILLQAAGFAWIALIARPALDYLQMLAPLAIAGAGVSLAVPAAQHAIVAHLPSDQLGKASGTVLTSRQLGGALGIAVAAAAFAATGSYRTSTSFTHGFAAAIAACVVLSLLGATCAAAMPGEGVIKLARPKANS